jgi:hypothetical protein
VLRLENQNPDVHSHMQGIRKMQSDLAWEPEDASVGHVSPVVQRCTRPSDSGFHDISRPHVTSSDNDSAEFGEKVDFDVNLNGEGGRFVTVPKV